MLFDKGCKHSLRILIASGNSMSKFSDNTKSATQTNFIALLQKVFHELGDTYVPVNITSGYRTASDQARIMSELLADGVNIAEYYSGATRSLPYLSMLQLLYDGHYNAHSHLGMLMIKSPFTQLILNYINGDEIILDTLPSNDPTIIMIGGKFYNINTVKSIFYKSIIPYRSILEQGLKNNIFKPSYHPLGQAFDLSPKTKTVEKAASLRTGGTIIKNTYIHFTIH